MSNYPYPNLRNLLENPRYHGKSSSPAEIDAMEQRLQTKFPLAFREFLLLTGGDYDDLIRGGGGFAQGLPWLPDIQSRAADIMAQCDITLPYPYIPIVDYIDQLAFIRTDEGDDPPFYGFEQELYYAGDYYRPGSSQSGYPKGVRLIDHSFYECVELVALEHHELLESLKK